MIFKLPISGMVMNLFFGSYFSRVFIFLLSCAAMPTAANNVTDVVVPADPTPVREDASGDDSKSFWNQWGAIGGSIGVGFAAIFGCLKYRQSQQELQASNGFLETQRSLVESLGDVIATLKSVAGDQASQIRDLQRRMHFYEMGSVRVGQQGGMVMPRPPSLQSPRVVFDRQNGHRVERLGDQLNLSPHPSSSSSAAAAPGAGMLVRRGTHRRHPTTWVDVQGKLRDIVSEEQVEVMVEMPQVRPLPRFDEEERKHPVKGDSKRSGNAEQDDDEKGAEVESAEASPV
jgi:hypothetical protein